MPEVGSHCEIGAQSIADEFTLHKDGTGSNGLRCLKVNGGALVQSPPKRHLEHGVMQIVD